MAIWIEIHCDIRAKKPLPTGGADFICATERGDGFGLNMENTFAAAVAAVRALRKRSLADGWHQTPQGWACPDCWRAMNTPALAEGAGTHTEGD